MRRLLWSLLLLLLVVACSRKGPTPTATPADTPTLGPTLTPSSTPTPAGSPVPRVTIVPSATRFPPTLQAEAPATTDSPTDTSVVPPTPSFTPTPRIIDAGATRTPVPSPTTLDSPLPTPPPSPTPSRVPPEGQPTLTSAASSASTPTSTPSEAVPTVTPTSSSSPLPTPTLTSTPAPGSSPTPTATPRPTAEGETWLFENLFEKHDNESQELYISGEVVNNSDDHRRITQLVPVVYDDAGYPLTSDADVFYLPMEPDYTELLAAIILEPEQSLAFSAIIELPGDIPIDENYEIQVESEPAEPMRDDLDIPRDAFDLTYLPQLFFVEGSYAIPPPDLTAYIAVIVTVYDQDDHVIGMGWRSWDARFDLTAGEHDFEIDATMWQDYEDVDLDIDWYRIQVFGY